MATNILRHSPSYMTEISESIRKRRAIVASLVYEDFTGKSGWIAKAVALAHKAGLSGTNEQQVKDDLLMYRTTYLWLKGDKTTREEFGRRRLHPSFTGVRHFVSDGVDTWQKLEMVMRKSVNGGKIRIYLEEGAVRQTTLRGAIIIAALRVLSRAQHTTLPLKELSDQTQQEVRAITRNGSFQLHSLMFTRLLRSIEPKYVRISYSEGGEKIYSASLNLQARH